MAASLSPRVFAKLNTDALLEARGWVDSVLDFRGRQATLFEAPAVAAVVPAGDTAVSLVAAPPCFSIPEILSPSAVSTFIDCSAKWYYRRVLHLPETRGAALAVGSAVHEAVASNFKQKLDTREDLPVEGAQTIARDAFERQLDEGVVLEENENPYELAQLVDGLVSCYMSNAAPSIDPAAVELPVSGEIGGVPVRGYVDLLDVHGNVIDLKTAASKPVGVRPSHKLQVTAYAMMTPQAAGRGRVDTITKTKTVKHYVETFDITDGDIRYAERMFSIVRDQMASGLVAPNRGSHLCSRKYCSFADQCESDYGGEV